MVPEHSMKRTKHDTCIEGHIIQRQCPSFIFTHTPIGNIVTWLMCWGFQTGIIVNQNVACHHSQL